jgi:DNA polymerase-3 subunit alpha
VEDGKIRFGLSAIKGLGEGSVQQIIEAREAGGKFTSIADFARRVPAKILNKKTLEALAFSGAMSALGERKQIGLGFESIAEFGKKAEASYVEGQAGLFDGMQEETVADELELPDIEPATPSENLKWEKEYLGLYVSSHPLAGLKKFFARKVIPLDQLPHKAVSKPVKVGGIIHSVRKITTKKGDMMAAVQLEDPFGKAEAVLFPKAYRDNYNSLVEDSLVMIDGVLEKRMGEYQVVVNHVEPMGLEKAQEIAKAEKLWTEGEVITNVSRQEVEAEEIQEAESVLEVEEGEVKDLEKKAEKNIYSIFINREVDRAFFVKLKAILEQHPGEQKAQVIIGEKVVPVQFMVQADEALKAEVDDLLKSA